MKNKITKNYNQTKKFKKLFDLKQKPIQTTAQGTIEYLVIIAIVIIIGLIVVSLTTNVFNIEQVSTSSNELKGQLGSQGISIIDTSSNQLGESFLNLKNTSNEVITLTKIQTIDKEKTNEYNAPLTQGNNEIIQLEGLCECETNQKTKTCELEIFFTTQHNLPKKVKQTITINCEENSEPIKPPIPPTLPEHCFDLNHNPIWICSLHDLNRIRENLEGNYILKKDIDASETTYWNTGQGWEPIGESYNKYFNGIIDGNNHIIKNIYINRQTDYVGFIGHANENAEIKNLGLTNLNINGGYSVGGIIGYNQGLVKNCYTTGNIKGQYSVGGLIGFNEGTIQNCYSTGNITGITTAYNIGGLVGNNNNIIENSYATGNISGVNYIGGLIGNSNGQTINCYSTGNITGELTVGGLIGYNQGLVKNCFATGNNNGTERSVGGLIGTNTYEDSINNYWDISRTYKNKCCGEGSNNKCQGKNQNNSEPNYFFPQENETYNPPIQNNAPSEGEWDFETIWKKVDNSYPILQWQE